MAQPLPAHRAREYETIFIMHSDSTADVIEQTAGKVMDVVGRLNGKLLRAENWGRRRLSYPVRKQSKGIYIYLKYLGYSDMVNEIERIIRMNEPIIKHMTVKLEEDVNPESRTIREEEIAFLSQVEDEPEPPEPRDSDSFRGGSSYNRYDKSEDRGHRSSRDDRFEGENDNGPSGDESDEDDL